jgi:hypothetical protein
VISIADLKRRGGVRPLLLAVAFLAVYWKLLFMKGLLITDDIFTSDIMNEGFPYRFALGAALHRGELPLWFTSIYGGFPLLARAEAGIVYPLNLLAFGLLPPYAAINLVIVATVLIAGLGAYYFVRELEVDPAGALLAGLAFGLSGFMVSHLKHLSMTSAACWLPWGLLMLERGIAKNRPRVLLWFGGVFALQILSGHIQIAYYAALLYGAYALARLLTVQPAGKRLKVCLDRRAWIILGSLLLAALIGAVQILPTYELVNLSQRAGGVSFEYASQFPFDPGSLVKLIYPGYLGEIGDATYRGSGIYWEDYGYVGFFTLLAALAAVGMSFKRWDVRFFAAAALIALLLVLGKNTPFFEAAFHTVPFLKYFRFPTRFLAIANLAIAVLGGIGLGELMRRMQGNGNRKSASRQVFLLSWIVVGLSFADLSFHQSRQNSIAPMIDWVHEPATATELRPMLGPNRFFPVGTELTHKAAFQKAGGWLGSLEVFTAQREFLQPSSNVLYDLPTPNGYAQLTPNYVVDVWGDQNRQGLMQQLWRVNGQTIETRPPFKRILSMHNTAFLLSPLPIIGEPFPLERRSGDVYIYRNPEFLPRVFLVGKLDHTNGWIEDLRTIASPTFNPRLEAVASSEVAFQGVDSVAGSAEILEYRSNEAVIRTSAGSPAVLVMSDMYYPGWEATIDGVPVPVFRVNCTMRGVVVSEGEHQVRYEFRPSSVRYGAMLSALGIALFSAGLILTRKVQA